MKRVNLKRVLLLLRIELHENKAKEWVLTRRKRNILKRIHRKSILLIGIKKISEFVANIDNIIKKC